MKYNFPICKISQTSVIFNKDFPCSIDRADYFFIPKQNATSFYVFISLCEKNEEKNKNSRPFTTSCFPVMFIYFILFKIWMSPLRPEPPELLLPSEIHRLQLPQLQSHLQQPGSQPSLYCGLPLLQGPSLSS